MIEATRIYISLGLFLLTLTLTFHLIAIRYPRWKIYEHRRMPNETMSIGIYQRCENPYVNIISNLTKISSVCDGNKYYSPTNQACISITNTNKPGERQHVCNLDNNSCRCDYSSITKGLISCTMIAACTLTIALLLIFSQILINQFKYKIHVYISIITIFLLFLGFIFILITLILLGSTMSHDLYQYRYDLDYVLTQTGNSNRDDIRNSITKAAAEDYVARLDWAGGLEILALILSSLTLITQIAYLFSTYRNQIG